MLVIFDDAKLQCDWETNVSKSTIVVAKMNEVYFKSKMMIWNTKY